MHLLWCPCGSEGSTTQDIFHDTFAAIALKSGTQQKVSHLFLGHTWWEVDILIMRNNF
jgi:hypothetical protein